MPSIASRSFVSCTFVFFPHVYIGLTVYYQVTLVKPSGDRKRETSIYQAESRYNMTSLCLTVQRSKSSPFSVPNIPPHLSAKWNSRAWNCCQTHCWPFTLRNEQPPRPAVPGSANVRSRGQPHLFSFSRWIICTWRQKNPKNLQVLLSVSSFLWATVTVY